MNPYDFAGEGRTISATCNFPVNAIFYGVEKRFERYLLYIICHILKQKFISTLYRY